MWQHLREVVCANALRAISGTDEALSLSGKCHLFALALRLKDARSQHLHRLVFVSVLRALVLPSTQTSHRDHSLRVPGQVSYVIPSP